MGRRVFQHQAASTFLPLREGVHVQQHLLQEAMMPHSAKKKGVAGLDRIVPASVLLTIQLYALLLVLFAVQRGLMLWRNFSQAADIPASTLAQSFLVGLRFDSAISAYLLIPTFLLLLVLKERGRAWLLRLFCALVAVVILLGIAELEFYRELEMRFNSLVFEYLSHPRIVGGMIWQGYPVLRYLLLWCTLTAFSVALVFWRSRRIRWAPPPYGRAWLRPVWSLLLLVLLIFASRGGFTHEPLRWGDAFFSEAPFANQLALNGIFTLGRSVLEKGGKKSAWTRAMPQDEALQLTRKMLLLPGQEDGSSAQYPLQRRETPAAGIWGNPQRPVNVVVILMESFSGRHVGALGAQPSLTPEFDRLSAEGILFTRAFSNGTHTHQGVFTTLASFPNLPGYEFLMKTMEAHQEFSGISTLMSTLGYQSIFLYNGLFSWDNKEGFFRKHGIDRFVGTEDYVDPTFVDPVWGVSDHDVFTRANDEFRAMAAKGPFFAAILTLSNHSPFNLPDPLPFKRVEAGTDLEGRHTAMRYADWALGEFFRQARKEAYFSNTLFVLTGDHGFGVPPALTDLQLDRFHVPLLFYSPRLLPSGGERRTTVASQVDVTPSILGLLGVDIPHQSWGRNLFSPLLKDEGFAVIKPSGGDDKVALIEGDRILIKEPKAAPQLFRYSLAFPPHAEPLADTEQAGTMSRRLDAYIETGLLALKSRRLGVPPGAAPAKADKKP
jgi:phosphoglycerol transferase MdoB-like AlkP superfamily enzyme